MSSATTNIDLDDELVRAARRLGAHPTDEAAVVAALREDVERRGAPAAGPGRLAILDLMGQVDYDDDYDYKAERRRDSDRVARALVTLHQPPRPQ